MAEQRTRRPRLHGPHPQPLRKPVRRAAAIATPTHEALRDHLLRTDGQEDVCFAIWHRSQGAIRLSALVGDLILPQRGERHVHSNASFESQYFLRAVATAAAKGAGLVLLHSHPGGRGWQGMSPDDIAAEAGHAAQAEAMTGYPLVGLTMAGDGAMSARFWRKVGPRQYTRDSCESVRVVGTRLDVTYDDALRPIPKIGAKQVRTVSAWGNDAQATLARLRIGIIGAGSVGAIIAEALARMGLQELILLDFDSVETHNLDRLLHATNADVGRAKVDVLADALGASATANEFKVQALQHSVVEEAGMRVALDCDLLFSCVDRPWPRQVLNFAAYAHLIPVIDGGIAIDTINGRLRGADWRAHVAAPSRRCLECLGQYDPSLVQTERDGFLDDPEYIKGLPLTHPGRRRENVFAFSLAAASLELAQLVQLVIAPSGISDTGAHHYHLVTGTIDREIRGCEPNCLYQHTLLGHGDTTGLVVTGQHPIAEAARINRESTTPVPSPPLHRKRWRWSWRHRTT